MWNTAFEELIQIEAEQLAETLCGTGYFELSPETKMQIRARAIDLLSPADVREGFVAAA